MYATCFSCSVGLVRYDTNPLMDGRDSGETQQQCVAGVATVRIVRMNAAVI